MLNKDKMIIVNNIKFQERIVEKYGHERVDAARVRLCEVCKKTPGCFLLPIQSDGCDCMYFNEEVADD